MMNRRALLQSLPALWVSANLAALTPTPSSGEKLALAARMQVGITTSYDPTWTAIAYPNGDVPRNTGVCADVVIRAARDGLNLDLQKLVHEDMVKNFETYPARKAWGSKKPDANIDHRRVLNLQTYFQRTKAQLWTAQSPIAGNKFPVPFAIGDIVTWLLDARLPHIGIIVSRGTENTNAHVVHNIGRGVEESDMQGFSAHRAVGHYRWPV